MAIVVSDTSPIRALAHLESMAWLNDLFESVVVPPAVAYELEHPPAGLRPFDVATWDFVSVQAARRADRVVELQAQLDLGESEAIAVAEEIHADAILIDELAGRAVAANCGLTVVGTLAVLLRAKQHGLCPAVEPLIDRLQNEINFFISPALRTLILQRAGEA